VLLFARLSCDCPALTDGFGKDVCGGWGAVGQVLAPSNELVAVRTGEEAGCYTFALDKTRFACKCRDVGRIMRTRLQFDTPYDYVKVWILENVYDEPTFVRFASTSLMDYDEAVAQAGGMAGVLVSWSNADDVALYLSTAPVLPVFVDMAKNNASSGGHEDLVWTSSGVVFDECDDDDSCGVQMNETIANATGWTAEMIAAMNFNNLLFRRVPGFAAFDGEMLYKAATSPLALPRIEQEYHVYAWTSSSSVAMMQCILLEQAVMDDGNTRSVWHCEAGQQSSLSWSNEMKVAEVQAFNASDSNRVPFYAYVSS